MWLPAIALGKPWEASGAPVQGRDWSVRDYSLYTPDPCCLEQTDGTIRKTDEQSWKNHTEDRHPGWPAQFCFTQWEQCHRPVAWQKLCISRLSFPFWIPFSLSFIPIWRKPVNEVPLVSGPSCSLNYTSVLLYRANKRHDHTGQCMSDLILPFPVSHCHLTEHVPVWDVYCYGISGMGRLTLKWGICQQT